MNEIKQLINTLQYIQMCAEQIILDIENIKTSDILTGQVKCADKPNKELTQDILKDIF